MNLGEFPQNRQEMMKCRVTIAYYNVCMYVHIFVTMSDVSYTEFPDEFDAVLLVMYGTQNNHRK